METFRSEFSVHSSYRRLVRAAPSQCGQWGSEGSEAGNADRRERAPDVTLSTLCTVALFPPDNPER